MYCVCQVSPLLLNSIAHTIYGLGVWVGIHSVFMYLFSEAFAGKYIQVVESGGEKLGRLGLHMHHSPQVT